MCVFISKHLYSMFMYYCHNGYCVVVCRYQHDRERLPESATNMKRLLTHLRNLPLKRKIATDLGLSDVLKSLSPTQDEGFLNDIARL